MNTSWFCEVLCLLMFVTGLRSNGQNIDVPKKPYMILLDDVMSEKPVYFSQLFSNCQLIPLETNENCLINHLSDIKIENNIIYILDRQMFSGRVLMFSNTGQYLSKVDKTGNGPGEYNRFSDYDIDHEKNQIAILDWSGKKLNFYDFQGNFKNELRFNYGYSSFKFSKNHIYLYKNPISGSSPEFGNDYLLHILSYSGNPIIKLLKSSATNYLKVSGIETGNVNFFNHGNDIKFMHSLCDTVYSIRDKRVEPFLIVETKKYKLTDEDIKAIDNDFRNRGSSSQPPLFTTIERFIDFHKYSENDRLIYFRLDLGLNRYFTFYDKISGKVICTRIIEDDLTYIYPLIESLNGDKMIAFINPSSFPKIKQNMASGKIKVSVDNKIILSKMTEFDNPIIVVLTLKE